MSFRALGGLLALCFLWAAAAGAQCGNGITDPGEDCDDGGTCIGGTNAGTHCTAESQCQGEGVCIGGSRAETACAVSLDCPGGSCVRCVPQGGDGCAANCTAEHDVSFNGRFDTGVFVLLNGTHASETYLSTGAQTLTVGRELNGQIPLVVKAESVLAVPMVALGCVCLRGIVARTCGGTVFEPDGALSPDCTPGFTTGDAVCAGAKPCADVHGAGNSASGVVGCDGLGDINLTIQQDWAATTGTPGALMSSLGGIGGPGSALVFKSTAVAIIVGPCVPSGGEFGSDGQFCTDDDPQSSRGDIVTSPAVTGTVSATALNANPSHQTIGPVSVGGAPFVCSDLVSGAAATEGALVTGALQLNKPSRLPNRVLIEHELIMAQPTETPLPTPTPTSASCIGDCNGDGIVTVDEILTMVDIALGSAVLSDCAAGDSNGDGKITVVEIVSAVNDALDGCAAM